MLQPQTLCNILELGHPLLLFALFLGSMRSAEHAQVILLVLQVFGSRALIHIYIILGL